MNTTILDWDETYRIFESNHLSKIIPKYRMIHHYVDTEIDGKVQSKDIILPQLEDFIDSKEISELDQIPTDNGSESALIRHYRKNPNYLDFYILNDGFCCLAEFSNTFLIVGNFQSHPFVITPTFKFFNSDGSTSENCCNFTYLNLEEIINLVTTKALEYIFDQQH